MKYNFLIHFYDSNCGILPCYTTVCYKMDENVVSSADIVQAILCVLIGLGLQ